MTGIASVRSIYYICRNNFLITREMKKIKTSVVAAILCGSMLLSSCVGSFPVFHKVLDWNRSLGNKFVNELVFIAFNVIPVYGVATAVDVIVLNTIEFWTGNTVVKNEVRTVQGTDGEYLVESSENGYSITKDGETVNLVFNAENNSWSYSDGSVTSELLHFNEDGTATLSNGRTVTLNAAGVMAARQSVNSGYLANR